MWEEEEVEGDMLAWIVGKREDLATGEATTDERTVYVPAGERGEEGEGEAGYTRGLTEKDRAYRTAHLCTGMFQLRQNQ